MTYRWFFPEDPRLPCWHPMEHVSWCAVLVANMALELSNPKKAINAYTAAVKAGLVFA